MIKRTNWQIKPPYFRDAIKPNDNNQSSSLSIFVEDPPTRLHPTHMDSASLFFPSHVLITGTWMLPQTN